MSPSTGRAGRAGGAGWRGSHEHAAVATPWPPMAAALVTARPGRRQPAGSLAGAVLRDRVEQRPLAAGRRPNDGTEGAS
jgi:hypothetical protein